MSTSARCRQDIQDRDSPALPGDLAHLQDDLAFGFRHDDGKYKVWLGKLQQIRAKGKGNLHGPINLCNPPDVKLQLQWFHETRKGSRRYVPSRATKKLDRKFVDISSCLGLVVFVKLPNGVRKLADNGQWERWQRNIQSMTPTAQQIHQQILRRKQRESRQIRESEMYKQQFVPSDRDQRMKNRNRSTR